MMYARVTTLEIDVLRTDVESALRLFDQQVLPRLCEQPGFMGVDVLANPDGAALLVSFWDTAEQAQADSDAGFYAEELARHVTLFRAPPGRQSYRVARAEHPVVPHGELAAG